MLKRLIVVLSLLVVLTACGANRVHQQAAQEQLPVLTKQHTITVYKSPTCTCCADWIAHLKTHGFVVKVEDTVNISTIKEQYGVPVALRSCHTGLVDGYAVEGHVPATDVQRLLIDRPNITGLAVGGMPIGSPGMETSGQTPQRFDVMTFAPSGTSTVFASYNQ